MATPQEIIAFWFEESTPEQWFKKDEGFDRTVIEHFRETYDAVVADGHANWRGDAEGCLAEILVLDQFSRNMFRDDPKAFAADARALACLKHAIAEGFDKQLAEEKRKFLYMPLMHSESAADQELSISMFSTLDDENTLDFAHRHKVIIDRFGRYPHRNAVLGRESTAEEEIFLAQPGSSF